MSRGGAVCGRWYAGAWLGEWGAMLNARGWSWGFEESWYDGPIRVLSIGPLHFSRVFCLSRAPSVDQGEGER